MSNFKVDTQLPTTTDIYLIDGRPFKDSFARKAVPIGEVFTDGTLPTATGLVDGLLAYNSDQKKLMVTLSGAWV